MDVTYVCESRDERVTTEPVASAQREVGPERAAASLYRRAVHPLPPRYELMTMNQPATIGPCGPRPRPAGGASAAGAGAGPRSG